MKNHSAVRRVLISAMFMLASIFGASTVIQAGEIASTMDDHGHRVFVNDTDSLSAPTANKTPALGSPYALRTLRSTRRTTPPAEISKIVETTASKHQVDPRLVHAIIQVESAYNTRALSRKGARGLMQLIPATAARFGVRNSFNPKQNIEGGVAYLKYLLNLFGGDVPLSVAAYNAGENAVLRKGGIPAYTETVNYVQRVTSLYSPAPPRAALVQKLAEAEKPEIYRLVDSRGLVHYTNGDSL